MTESIKFGPEWLRNSVANVSTSLNDQTSLSAGTNSNMNSMQNSNSNMINSRPQLAENRYGREEMLSLCEKSPKRPEILPKYKKLFVEQPQFPLALTPQTEDEVRIWQIRNPVSIGLSGRGGRGGSIDRGRGRARTPFHSSSNYQRSTSLFDEDQRGNGRGERPWLDRNGTGDGQMDWTSPTAISPRKEYGTGMHVGRSTSIENWRKSSRTEDEGGDWRNPVAPPREKWTRSTSWREDEGQANLIAESGSAGGPMGQMRPPASIICAGGMPGANNESATGPVSGANGNGGSDRLPPGKSLNPMSKKSWDEENLPEWATENPSDYGGSFDATGAFHDSEDDDLHHQQQKEFNGGGPGPHYMEQRERAAYTNRQYFGNASPGKMHSDSDLEQLSDKEESKQHADIETSTNESGEDVVHVPGKTEEDLKNVGDGQLQKQHHQAMLQQQTQKAPQQLQQQPHHQSAPPPPHPHMHQSFQNKHFVSAVTSLPVSSSSPDDMQHVNYMLNTLIMDDDNPNHQLYLQKSRAAAESQQKQNQAAQPQQKPPQLTQGPPGAPQPNQQPPQPQPVASTTGLYDWFYKDPQGEVQGPFSVLEMSEWFKACYFQDSLQVRRSCDSRYYTLGELIKFCNGAVPFLVPNLMLPGNEPNPTAAGFVSVPPAAPNPGRIDDYYIQQMAEIDMRPENFLNYQLMQQQQQQQPVVKGMQSVFSLHQQPKIPVLPSSAQPNLVAQVLPPPAHKQQPPQTQAQAPQAQPQAQAPAQPPLQVQTTINELNRKLMQPTGNVQPHVTDPVRHMMQNLGYYPSHQTQSHAAINQQSIGQQNQQPLDRDPIKAMLMQLQMQKSGSTAANNDLNWMKQPVNPNLMHHPNIQEQQTPQPPQPTAGQQTNTSSSVHWSGKPVNMWELGLPQYNQNQPQTAPQQTPPQQSVAMEATKMDSHQALEEKMLIASKRETEQLEQNKMRQQFQQVKPDQNLAKQKKQEEEERQKKNQQKKQAEQQLLQQQQQQQAQKKEAEKKEAKQKEAKKQAEEEQKRKRLQQQQQQFQLDELKKTEAKKAKQQQLEDEQRSSIQATMTKLQQQQKQQQQQLQMQQQQQRQQQESYTNRAAPWSTSSLRGQQQSAQGLTFEEIQKAEQEAARRAESLRIEQQMREQHLLDMQQQKENILKWNAQNILPKNVKSLDEIQAEEHAKQAALDRERESQAALQAKREKKEHELQAMASIWNSHNIAWNSNSKPWGQQQMREQQMQQPTQQQPTQQMSGTSTSSGGFWEEPTKYNQTNSIAKNQISTAGTKIMLSKSQTMVSISTSNSTAIQMAAKQQQKQQQQVANALNNNKINKFSQEDNNSNDTNNNKANHKHDAGGKAIPKSASAINKVKKDDNNEFTSWCTKALGSIKADVDIPTFIGFLKDIESPYEVKDYIKMYLGENKECIEFAKQFLERRSKYKNMQRTQNAHIDDMCAPAPAITPSSDFQEVKGKNKKVKKNKMMKVDSRILGFSVSAAPDRLNVGDRDYGETS